MDDMNAMMGVPDFSQPRPLDFGARLAQDQAAQNEMLETYGTDAIEQLINLPRGYDIIDAQHERWSRATSGHQSWAEVAKICTEFFEGEQWTAAERALLAEEGRPINTKNKIAPLMRLLMGFFRQNRWDIRVLAGNDGTGSEAVADIINAVFKQIAERNSSAWVDAQVFQDGLLTGRGFWDIRLDFARNRLGEVKEIVLDPFALYIDPEADSYDPNGTGTGSAWSFATYNKWMTATEIFMLYGKLAAAEVSGDNPRIPVTGDTYTALRKFDISPSRWFGLEEYMIQDFESSMKKGGNVFDHLNRRRKLFRVLDCQYKQLKKVDFFVDLSTGQEKIIPDGTPREKIQRIMQYVQARGIPIDVGTDYKEVIRWTVTAGDRVLFDKWSPYDNYTVVPYFPYFRRGKTQSPIKDLLDPQREINKRSAAFLHIIMTTANSGWIWEKGSLDEDMKDTLENEGGRPGIQIEYAKGANAPQRIQPAATPVAMKQLEIDATVDIKEIAGINDSALGQLDVAQSGVAVQARQRQAIIGADPYFDNFSRSRELKGRQYLHLVQGYYTEQRMVRIQAGASSSQAEEHQYNIRTAAGEIQNNVTLGSYDLVIDEAPMSTTFQQGQFEDAIMLVEKGIPIPPDILVELSSMPRKQEIKMRLNEERVMQMNDARLQNIMNRGAAGIPPDVPLPPVVTDGSPNVLDLSQQEAPSGAMPMPAAGGGSPMSGQADPLGTVPTGMPPQVPVGLSPEQLPLPLEQFLNR